MPNFDSTNVNEQVTLFFKILEYIYTNGTVDDLTLDEKLKQFALSDKQKSDDYFKFVLDQPAFMTDDHKRLRKMLVDWYAANRSLITRMKFATDPFSLPDEALNELIKSFGFPYPDKIITPRNKVLFLLDLVNLYKKKGTPESLSRALQYFGLTNITLSEWWIHKNLDGNFVARSSTVLPRDRVNISEKEIPYDEFIENDPLWHFKLADLIDSYSTAKITLPSITPYFSIDASYSIKSIYPIIAITARKLQDCYEYWLTGGELPKNIEVSQYETTVSFLELCLGIAYIFCGKTESIDNDMYIYSEEIGIEDEHDYDVIINEYNDIISRPSSRQERDYKLSEYSTKFKGQISNYFIQNVSDIETYLNLINSDFKDYLDGMIELGQDEAVLERLLLAYDGYIEKYMKVSELSLSYMIFGSSAYERIKPIINFFKPYRSRLRDFLTSFLIDDQLVHLVINHEVLTLKLSQDQYDIGAYVDILGYPSIVEDSYALTKVSSEFNDMFGFLDMYLKDESLASLFQEIYDDYNNMNDVITQSDEILLVDSIGNSNNSYLDTGTIRDHVGIDVYEYGTLIDHIDI